MQKRILLGGKAMSIDELFSKLGYKKEEYTLVKDYYKRMGLKEETLYGKVSDTYPFLLKIGCSKKEIIKMSTSFAAIYSYNVDNLSQKLIDLEELGYTKKEVIKIIKEEPQVFGYSINKIKRKLNSLEEIGYERKNVLKITYTTPVIFSYDSQSIKNKIDDLMELGYKKKDVLKMTKAFPKLYNLSIEYIKQRIKDMILLGYTKEEIINMTIDMPTIYGYGIDNITGTLEKLEELNYTKEEVLNMTKNFPAIFGYSAENLKQKIEFYDYIDLHEIIANESFHLMQSAPVSYARYKFYNEEEGISIDINNYGKLFVNNKYFEKHSKITKRELLEKYKFETYLEEKNKVNVKKKI
ncbi:MAG: hypothetical protein E7160_01680 [Firmicutes bacterium]|nr:hypothetical protein [Bacillota bacterium]